LLVGGTVLVTHDHHCFQENKISNIYSDIRDIRQVLYGNKGLKYGSIVAIIAALFAASVFIFDMRAETAVTKSQITDVRSDILLFQKDSQELRKTVEENNEASIKRYQNIILNLQLISSKIEARHKKGAGLKR
jgi:hypothetical protein